MRKVGMESRTKKNAFSNAIRVKIISSYLLTRVTVKTLPKAKDPFMMWSS